VRVTSSRGLLARSSKVELGSRMWRKIAGSRSCRGHQVSIDSSLVFHKGDSCAQGCNMRRSSADREIRGWI